MPRSYVMDESSLGVGELRTHVIDGEKILFYRLADGFYATQAKCPHLGAPLEKGTIVDDCRIQCKFHHAEFDIRSGTVCEWANFPPGIQALNFLRGKKDLKTYSCESEDGKVYVTL